MIVETLSVFPEMFEGVMSSSILGRARKKGILDFHAYDLRDWTHDRHRTTDDEIYGGGAGLLMCCPPIFEAVESICSTGPKPHVIFFTPTGRPFNQDMAAELAGYERLLMICGRYEGIDERAYTLADRCISLGDYVLTGGELAAMVVCDCVARYVDGVLSPESLVQESFSENLLEYPHYTRPVEYRGLTVPEVLRSGNHAEIDKWRREQSLESTTKKRPDLL